MISDTDIERVLAASERFKPVLIGARYHADSDRIELRMSWCTLLVERRQIVELRDISPSALETISVSPVGIHVDSEDIDINAAGLLASIAKKLAKQAAKSV
jgi:hypothetical protein